MLSIPESFWSTAIAPVALQHRERISINWTLREHTQLFFDGVTFCLAASSLKPNTTSFVRMKQLERGLLGARNCLLPLSDSPLSSARFSQCLAVAFQLPESPDPATFLVIKKHLATINDNGISADLPTDLHIMLEKYQAIGRLARQLVAPIYRLPPEILVDILLYAVSSEGLGNRISSFCLYWTAALLADPRVCSNILAVIQNANHVENLHAISKLPSLGLPLTVVLNYDPEPGEIPADSLIMPLSIIIIPIARRLKFLYIRITNKWDGSWDLPLNDALGLMLNLTDFQLRLSEDSMYEGYSTPSFETSIIPTEYWCGHWKFIRSLEGPKLKALCLCGPGSLAGIPRLIAAEKLLVLSLISLCDESHASCRIYLDAFTAALSCQNLQILTLDLCLGNSESLILRPTLSEIHLPHITKLTLNVRKHADTRNSILNKLRTPSLSTFTLGVYVDENLFAALDGFYNRSQFELETFIIKGEEDQWTAEELMIFLQMAGDGLTTLTLNIPFSDDESIWIDLADEDVLPCLRELTITRSAGLDDYIDDALLEMLNIRWWCDEESNNHRTCSRLQRLNVLSGEDDEDVIDPENIGQWQKYRVEGMELDLQCPSAEF